MPAASRARPLSAPASRALASGTAPVRDAYRQGAAQGYRDAQPPSDPGDPGRGADALAGGATQPGAPTWAQSLARRQRTTQAGLVAAQALREGDRPAGGSRPGSQGQELRERADDASSVQACATARRPSR